MTSGIHPHWKSTGGAPPPPPPPPQGNPPGGDDFWPMPPDAAGPSPEDAGETVVPYRVPVRRTPRLSLLFLSSGSLCIALLLVFFLRGVDLIRGSLLAKSAIEVTVGDAAFDPASVTAAVGDIVSFRNAALTPQRFESDERGEDGLPLLAALSFGPGETFVFTLPETLAGKNLHLRNVLLPTATMMLVVEAERGPELVLSRAEVRPRSEEVPAAPDVPSPAASPTKTSPSPAPVPLPAGPVPVLDVSQILLDTQRAPLLRVNPSALGTSFVPPPVRPPLHAAAPLEAPRHLATGLPLSALGLMSLFSLPFLLRKKKM